MEERNAITLIMGKDVRLLILGVCLPMNNLSSVNMMLHVGTIFAPSSIHIMEKITK